MAQPDHLTRRAGAVERSIEKMLFAARWLLAPMYLGLSLALLALGLKFFEEAWHVLAEIGRAHV